MRGSKRSMLRLTSYSVATMLLIAAVAAGVPPKAAELRTAEAKTGPMTAAPVPLPTNANHVIAVPAMKEPIKPSLMLTADPWKRAACLTGFLETGGKKAAGHPTWVYLYYDQTALWVAFRCEGQNGTGLRQEIVERDGKVWRDDSVEIKLDPTGTSRNFFHFVINSTGNLYDAYGKEDQWSAEPTIKTATDAKGWSAMIGIPFAAIKAKTPQPGQAWAANFYRNVVVKKEEETTETPYTKVRTSWVPGLISLDGPDNYGRLLFGPEGLSAVRMRLVNPMAIGRNNLALDPTPDLRFSVTGMIADRQPVFKTQPQPAEQGTVSFVIADDRIRTIELTLENTKGELLSRNTYPMLSPEVTARARMLPKLAGTIRSQMSKFPEKARAQTQKLLTETRPQIGQAVQMAASPGDRTPGEWENLNKAVTELELKLDDPACLGRTIEKLPQSDFAVGLEGPMRKVMIRDFPFSGWFDDHYDVALARNEHEGLQVVVMPFERDLKNTSVAVSPLKASNGGTMAGGKVEVSLVGHVDVVDTPPYQDITYHGWYPDPLLNFQKSCEAKAGDNVAFWIDVATGKDTPAGRYEATVTVSADECRPVMLRLQVTVWDFMLPDGTHLRNAFTYAEPSVGRFYKDRWGREMRYKYYDFILDHRLNIDNLYRGDRPDIEVLKYGVSKGMNAFNVGAEFRLAGATGKRIKELDDYVAQLKKEGLFKYAYVYGFDEVREEKFAEMRMVFSNIHRLYPGLKTMTTAGDHSFGARTKLRTAVDIWVPLTDWYDKEEARQLRKKGGDMWWYICIVPCHPYANFFVEYAAIEPRLLTGTMSYKYEAGGFLYYLINLWDNNKKVVGPGPYTDWDPGSFANSRGKIANGDGSLMCPGPDGPLSTIRMENIRDGFEDYEYLYRLGELAGTVRKLPESAAAKAFLAKADELLAVPDNVINSVVEFSTDPKHLSDYRAKLATAILEGQKLAGVTGRQ